MKKHLRILAMALFAMTTVSTSYAQEVTEGDITFDFQENGSAYVKKYNGTATEVTIPAEVKNTSGEQKNVTGIGESAFEGNKTVKKILISNNVSQTVGKKAFKDCTALTTLCWTNESEATATYKLNNSDGQIVLIGADISESAFEGCTSIIEVKSRYKNTQLMKNSFKGCVSLDSISLGASGNGIAEGACEGCTALRVVTFGGNSPSNLEEIGDNAFKGCTILVTIGKTTNRLTLTGIKKIGNCAFENCTSIKTVQGSSLTEIGDNAFKNSGLTTFTNNSGNFYTNRITLLSKTTKVGVSAFEGTPSASVYFDDGTVPNELGEKAFVSETEKTIYLPIDNLLKESVEALNDYKVRTKLTFKEGEYLKVLSAKMELSLNSETMAVKYVKSVEETSSGITVITEETPSKTLYASTALIVQYTGASDKAVSYTLSISKKENKPDYTNYLIAANEGITLPASNGTTNYYTFATTTPENKTVEADYNTFAKVIEETTIPAGSGYLKVAAGTPEAGTTGIRELKADDKKADVFYNLNGVRVENPQKGIFIRNGKKVVIK